MTNDEIVRLYHKLGVDIFDLDTDGWKGCESCPRRKLVRNPKFECDFGECLTNFVETGHSIDLRELEIIKDI
jgi:hypothetical protein